MQYSELNELKNSESLVHFDGKFVTCSGSEPNEVTVSVLLDTGALCASYISMTKFELLKEREIVTDDMIIVQRSRVGLADNATTLVSECMIELPILLKSWDGSWFSHMGIFIVLDMKTNEVIIGLPDIVRGLWKFFLENLETRRESRKLCKIDGPCTLTAREFHSPSLALIVR